MTWVRSVSYLLQCQWRAGPILVEHRFGHLTDARLNVGDSNVVEEVGVLRRARFAPVHEADDEPVALVVNNLEIEVEELCCEVTKYQQWRRNVAKSVT